MDKKTNRYLSLTYKLYTDSADGRTLAEEAPEEQPFQFITGFNYTLDAFEAAVITLATGDTFDFTLTPEQAFGQYDPKGVQDVAKEIFSIDGKFDSDNVYEGNDLPLQDSEGHRFYGRVKAVGADTVTIDVNHPLAGKSLNFVGRVVESREATNEEIQALINRMSGGCHGHCGDCGGDCGGGSCHKDDEACHCADNSADDCGCHGEGKGQGHCHCN